ncbi:MAG: stealth conserved region 3 domain-containing protein [Spirochaetaceae bacterium]|nr:stealth conserved region 3 domain-containing protein [Spirochaetaceae bacterium]
MDGSDPAWIEEFNKYCPEDKRIIDASEKRYRDFGLLRYWFRGVEQFAPWVRKVHFVTCGQKPDWLNLSAPKLHWVQHKDYIPQEYLPVFSANPIELMMHKIPGIAEQIVYFNDDLFLTSPVRKKFFFRNGLPCDSAILGTISLTDIGHILLNNNNLINSVFSKKKVIRGNLGKWLNVKYGKALARTLLLLPYAGFTGFYNPHYAVPYTKSLLEEVWRTFPDALTTTMGQRFRSQQDVNQYLFQDYRFCTGQFYPMPPHYRKKMITLSKDNVALAAETIRQQRFTQIVLNDSDDVDFDAACMALADAFESILPEKSVFEV